MFKHNSLNTIRLFAALSIFWLHVVEHLRISEFGIFVVLKPIFHIVTGVPIFFFLSGYLVWYSLKKNETLKKYARRRFIRIYPELWLAVILEIITILFYYREAIDYLRLVIFAITQGTFLQFWTPEFLRGYGCGTPNGSLWTICILIQFYIVIWFAKKPLRQKRFYVWCSAFAALLIISYCGELGLCKLMPDIINKLYNQTIIPYAWLFFLGVACSEYHQRLIPITMKYWPYTLLVLVIMTFAFPSIDLYLTGYPVVKSILLMLTIIGWTYKYQNLNIQYDISYGIYIFHMIIVNVFIQCGLVGETYLMLVVLAITIVMSILSKTICGYFIKKYGSSSKCIGNREPENFENN